MVKYKVTFQKNNPEPIEVEATGVTADDTWVKFNDGRGVVALFSADDVKRVEQV